MKERIDKLLNSKSNDKLIIYYSGGFKEEMEKELLGFMSEHEFNFVGSLMDIQNKTRELEFESKYSLKKA